MDENIKTHKMKFCDLSSEQVPPPNPPPAGDTGKTHELKCWPKYFDEIVYRKKNFEVRYNDRGYSIGDTLILREYDNDKKEYTRRQTRVKVTDIFADFGLISGWVVMAIEPFIP